MKKLMEFFFGKKYPIFDKEGQIYHSRKESFDNWKNRYAKNPNCNWRYHTGMNFKDTKK